MTLRFPSLPGSLMRCHLKFYITHHSHVCNLKHEITFILQNHNHDNGQSVGCDSCPNKLAALREKGPLSAYGWVVVIPKRSNTDFLESFGIFFFFFWKFLDFFFFFFLKSRCHIKRRILLLVWQRLRALGTLLHTAAQITFILQKHAGEFGQSVGCNSCPNKWRICCPAPPPAKKWFHRLNCTCQPIN